VTTELTAAYEGTTYTIALPQAAAHSWFCGASIAFAIVCMVVARRRWFLVPIGAIVAAAIGGVATWSFPRSAPSLSIGALFAAAYEQAGVTAACGAAGLVAATIAMVVAPRAAPDATKLRARAPYVITGVAMAIAFMTLGLAIRQRVLLGSTKTQLPLMMTTGRWSGHVGYDHEVHAALGEPTWTGFFRTTLSQRELTADEWRARGWECDDDCRATVHPTTVGATSVLVHGHAGRVRYERRLEFTGLRELGNALWPMRVGERHVFALQSSRGQSTGGWAVAIADGAHALVPHELGGPSVQPHVAELRVARTMMKDGLRHFVVEVTREGEPPFSLEVYALDGETWVERDGFSAVKLIEAHHVPSEGAYYCELRGLPFSICNAGGDRRFHVMGPVGGMVSGGDSGKGLLITFLTLGAVAPGSGPESHYCLESAESGDGESMPVADSPPNDIPSGEIDPRLGDYATCAELKKKPKPAH
jgi:hypothetical protein